MSIGEEQTECPLCMEPLEMDDLNFFPCTCGYQICRFCWHRIRTDESGLCPACRKQYPEDPAAFKPLTEDELQRIKKERRQKDLQRKQKAAENRKHLANVRVVQKNLVFVVGLSQRLADPEVLKKPEYFGKFGKIHKVVINHSTSYAGAQGPSASAYVTYNRPEDALRAIQAVNNIYVDGRTLKASLGTTKYCSHFLRGAQCPKGDCMYLHELGEDAASFTKEEMQQGKHQDYEQKLNEQFMNSQNLTNHPLESTTATFTSSSPPTTKTNHPRNRICSPQTIQSDFGGETPSTSSSKDAWPSLEQITEVEKPERLTNGNKSPTSSAMLPPQTSANSLESVNTENMKDSVAEQHQHKVHHKAPGHHRNPGQNRTDQEQKCSNNKDQTHQQSLSQNSRRLHLQHNSENNCIIRQPQEAETSQPQQMQSLVQQFEDKVAPGPKLISITSSHCSPFDTNINPMSLFSNSGFSRQHKPHVQLHTENIPTNEIPDTITVSTTTDWQAAFGFTSTAPQVQNHAPVADLQDDDLDLGENHHHHNPQLPRQTQCYYDKQPPSHTSDTNHHISSATNPISSNLAAVKLPLGSKSHHQEDDLGFDPWDESSRALQDLIAKESIHDYQTNTLATKTPMPVQSKNHHMVQQNTEFEKGNKPKNLPPGFFHNHIDFNGRKRMDFTVANITAPQNTYHDVLSDISLSSSATATDKQHNTSQTNMFNAKDWQDGLRALLPNINISFGPPSGTSSKENVQAPSNLRSSNGATRSWSSQPQTPSDLALDPAIVTSGNITDNYSLSEEPPHWMASLQHLTEDNTTNRLPFLHQFPFTATPPTWATQAQHPPPGFHTTGLPPATQISEGQKLATEGL